MNMSDEIRAGVHATLNAQADIQVSGAAQLGIPLTVVTEVYLDDGAKNYATALAKALCTNTALVDGTREDMAVLVTSILQLAKPFNPARLSKPLTVKAKKLVAEILNEHGYNTVSLTNGLSIRDIVKAGIGDTSGLDGTHSLKTRFEVDGVWFESKWYPYERVATYEIESPWYALGLRFAGDLIPLKSVLAMRGMGINQFIGLDEAAHKRATPEALAKRSKLIESRRAERGSMQ